MRTECIAWFNDHQMTVDPVLAAFDRAIAAGDPTICPIGPGNAGKVLLLGVAVSGQLLPDH
jgi:hypothetical protein